MLCSTYVHAFRLYAAEIPVRLLLQLMARETEPALQSFGFFRSLCEQNLRNFLCCPAYVDWFEIRAPYTELMTFDARAQSNHAHSGTTDPHVYMLFRLMVEDRSEHKRRALPPSTFVVALNMINRVRLRMS